MSEKVLVDYGRKIKVGNGSLNVYTEGDGTQTMVIYHILILGLKQSIGQILFRMKLLLLILKMCNI